MSPTTLGMMAVGDPNLLRQIERGRSPSPRTADRILAFMAAYAADPGGAGARPARLARPRPATRWRQPNRSGAMSRDRRSERTKPGDPFPADLRSRGADRPVADHDLRLVGGRALPPARPPEQAGGALDRVGGRGMDGRAGRAGAGAGTPRRQHATPRRREHENVVENAASGRVGRSPTLRTDDRFLAFITHYDLDAWMRERIAESRGEETRRTSTDVTGPRT